MRPSWTLIPVALVGCTQAPTPPDVTAGEFRPMLIPVTVRDVDGDIALSMGARGSALSARSVDATDDWAMAAGADRARLRVEIAGRATVVYETLVGGDLSVATGAAEGIEVIRVRDDAPAFRVVAPDLGSPVELLLRVAAPPLVTLRDGVGIVTRDRGPRDEGPVAGRLTVQTGQTTDFMALHLRWAPQRLLGLTGGKTRTMRIPTSRMTSLRWTRLATRDGDSARLSDRSRLEVQWKIPPDRPTGDEEKAYSVASARIVATLTPEDRAKLSAVELLLRQRAPIKARYECCYPSESLASYLRFKRGANAGSDRCDVARQCTQEELIAFDRP